MGLADNLQRLRAKAGLSQGELAAVAKVSQQLISQIENGTNTTTKKLPAIAKALGVTIEELDETFAMNGSAPASQTDRERLLRLFDELDPALRPIALRQVAALKSAKS